MDLHLDDSPGKFNGSKKDELEGLNERELLERLLELACPSCGKSEIQDAAESLTQEA